LRNKIRKSREARGRDKERSDAVPRSGRGREREGENRNSVKLCEKLRVTLWQKEKGEKRKPK
jgi:hypothetical protein